MFKKSKVFMGFDLAASPLHPTGWAVVDEKLKICVEPGELFSEEEILDRVRKFRPRWIGIDAPLSFPRKGSKTRLCDRELRRFGSPTLSPFLIAPLTRRGILLYQRLSQEDYPCIEVYPRATQNILRIKTPKGEKSGRKWRSSLQRSLSLWMKNIPLPEEKLYSSHILDALLCAYTAYCRWRGNYREVGDEQGKVIVPSF